MSQLHSAIRFCSPKKYLSHRYRSIRRRHKHWSLKYFLPNLRLKQKIIWLKWSLRKSFRYLRHHWIKYYWIRRWRKACSCRNWTCKTTSIKSRSASPAKAAWKTLIVVARLPTRKPIKRKANYLASTWLKTITWPSRKRKSSNSTTTLITSP